MIYQKKQQVAKDTYAFYFKKPEGFNFIPGQYVRITLPHENPDERGEKRFFSLAISPNDMECIRIITKIIPQMTSFKRTLFNLPENTEVMISPPMGKFVLKDEAESHVFLVGGIGITPVISIVSWAAESNYQKPITVLVSFSTPEEIVFKEQLEHLTQGHPSIKLIYTVSHPEESQALWSGETGRISEDFIKKYVPDILKPYYYIVGPPSMVEAMENIAQNLHVATEHIVKESFTGY